MQRSLDETKEIERHKYFLSEKQGLDVGWEFAEADWERHYADRWRREQANQTRSASAEGHPAAGSCCCAEPSAASDACLAEAEPAEELTARHSGRGPLSRLLSRLFQQAS